MANGSSSELERAQTSSAFHMLGDETRRAIVEELARGPRSVGQLALQMPVSRSAVSQHLAALKDAGLVTDRAEGTRRIYRLDPSGLQLLRTYLDRMWASALEGFRDAAELSAIEMTGTPQSSTPQASTTTESDTHD